MIKDQECIKFPECLGCTKVVEQEWYVTGSLVRMCAVYLSPTSWWRRGTCPIVYKHVESAGKIRVGQKKSARRAWK